MPFSPAQCNSINKVTPFKTTRCHTLHLTNNIQQFPRASQPPKYFILRPHFSSIFQPSTQKGRTGPPTNCSCARRAQRLFRSPPDQCAQRAHLQSPLVPRLRRLRFVRAPCVKWLFGCSVAALAERRGCSGCSVFCPIPTSALCSLLSPNGCSVPLRTNAPSGASTIPPHRPHLCVRARPCPSVSVRVAVPVLTRDRQRPARPFCSCAR